MNNETTATSNFIYSTKIPVRIYDINYGNHLAHDSLISILHEARALYLKQNSLSELDLFGTGLILTSLNVDYISQSNHGDLLTINLGIDNVSRSSFEFFYTVENHSSKIVAKARTKMVCYDYKLNKVVKIPSLFLDLIK